MSLEAKDGITKILDPKPRDYPDALPDDKSSVPLISRVSCEDPFEFKLTEPEITIIRKAADKMHSAFPIERAFLRAVPETNITVIPFLDKYLAKVIVPRKFETQLRTLIAQEGSQKGGHFSQGSLVYVKHLVGYSEERSFYITRLAPKSSYKEGVDVSRIAIEADKWRGANLKKTEVERGISQYRVSAKDAKRCLDYVLKQQMLTGWVNEMSNLKADPMQRQIFDARLTTEGFDFLASTILAAAYSGVPIGDLRINERARKMEEFLGDIYGSRHNKIFALMAGDFAANPKISDLKTFVSRIYGMVESGKFPTVGVIKKIYQSDNVPVPGIGSIEPSMFLYHGGVATVGTPEVLLEIEYYPPITEEDTSLGTTIVAILVNDRPVLFIN